MLPYSTQKFFQKRICILGPESTGKTTMSRLISKKYNIGEIKIM